MLAEQLERQKIQMEEEIHILLDIQAEKSRTINALESQFQQSEHSIGNLNEKLSMLTDNFSTLEEHISVMKERLLNAEARGEELERKLRDTQMQINEREQIFHEQKDREMRIRDEIESHKHRQTQRLSEIRQLIT